MNLKQKNVVITGSASGIGEALAKQFIGQGSIVVLADKNERELNAVSQVLGCSYFVCDVGNEESIRSLVEKATQRLGHIDLFCSNAGVFHKDDISRPGLDEKKWRESWEVNVMSHVYAARYVLPQMLDRKSGYFLQIISAAALLSQVGASAYSATKSSTLSFAESLAINYGTKGIKVSAVCPQYVATPMLGFKGKSQEIRNKNLISSEEAANCIIKGVNEGTFLIVTDSKVMHLFEKKCRNYERWISGMQRLNNKVVDENKGLDLEQIYKLL